MENRTITAYAIAYGAFLLTGGRLGDLFGHRRIFIFGIGWFALWSGVIGFARNPVIMSLGRALQGSGSGLTIPSALAIITTSYPVGPQRNKAVAIFGGTAAVGPVAGLFLGGILGATIGKIASLVLVHNVPSENESPRSAPFSYLSILFYC